MRNIHHIAGTHIQGVSIPNVVAETHGKDVYVFAVPMQFSAYLREDSAPGHDKWWGNPDTDTGARWTFREVKPKDGRAPEYAFRYDIKKFRRGQPTQKTARTFWDENPFADVVRHRAADLDLGPEDLANFLRHLDELDDRRRGRQ